jgi:outer membrane receptor protein involved in Fe transport
MKSKYLFKKIAFLFCLAFSINVCLVGIVYPGVTGKIAGRIIDASTNEPLAGVNVILEGTYLGAATDFQGYYTILKVPPGTYTILARMMGYKETRQTDVYVRVDLTTTVNFNMEMTVLPGEEVTIVADRPMVIKDISASSTRVDAEEIEDIPSVTTVTDAVQLMPGIVGEGEEIHARGGRSGEVVYMVDGISVNDALFNSQIVAVNKYSVQEIEMLTGGYNAEYGNAQSGIVNIVTRTGGTRLTGRIAYFSDHLIPSSGIFPSDIYVERDPLEVRGTDYLWGEGEGIRKNSLNSDRTEFNLGGPEPITNNLLPALGFDGLKGKISFFLSGTAEISDGYLPNEDQSAELVHYNEMFQRGGDVLEAGEADSVWFVNPRNVDHPFLEKFLGLKWGGRYSNNYNYSARMKYRMTNSINLSASLLGSQFWNDSYRHTYRFQMDRSQMTEGRNRSIVVNWNHSLSSKSFYTVKLGYLKNNRLIYPGTRNGIAVTPEFMNNRIGDGDDNYYPDAALSNTEDPDDPLNSDTADERAGQEDPRTGAFESGYNGDSTWGKHSTETYTVKADYLNQITRYHEIKAGIEWKYNELRQGQIDYGGNKVPSRRIVPPDNGPWITSGALRDFYVRYPNTGAAYVQDKIEFESLIVNLGFRFDRFDPGEHVFEIGEAFQTEETEKEPVNTKNYFSPRMGLSHPISDRSRLYFFYGRFIQIPTMRELYRRQNRFRIFQNQANLFGNADLEAEETISYEVGFDHQLTDDLKFGVTGFYKDIRNQINFATFGSEVTAFRKLVNRDFGQDRGFEFDIQKRFSNYFGFTINYTLMWATTRSSSFDRGIGALGAQQYPQLMEVPSDWDQRHTINGNFHFEIPAGQGFRILGYTFDRASLHVFWRYGSGVPFTVHEDADPNATINAERLPFYNNVDLRFRKDFKIIGAFFTTFYVEVMNVFNRRNVVYLSSTPRHRTLEYEGKSYPNGNIYGDGSLADLLPQQLSPPRQVYLGFGFRF